MSTFIGRQREIAQVKEMLEDNRLVTLTGAGGTGKTRLALQAAAESLDSYEDGIFFVDLSPIRDPDLVLLRSGTRRSVSGCAHASCRS